jgi:hypothetical protein
MENVNSNQAKAFRIVLKNSTGRSVVTELDTAADLAQWIEENGKWECTYSSAYESLHAKAGIVPARGGGYVDYALEVQIYEPTIDTTDDGDRVITRWVMSRTQKASRRVVTS